MSNASVEYWLVLTGANLPAYLLVGWLLFGTWRDFASCVKSSLTPEVVSFLRGDWAQSWLAEFKLFTFIAGCALVVLVEHWGIVKLGWIAGG